MLDLEELHEVANAFGVDERQVLRDHLISHLLAAISAEAADDLVFFGGTALARSVLPDGRLSEDIDLIASGSRPEIARHLTAALPHSLRREFPGVAWQPSPADTSGSAPAVLRTTDGLAVRIQLLSSVGYPVWPTRRTALVQRYSDVAPATLITPTAPGFAAAKAVAWHHRRASRDLWDVWALAGRGHVDAVAADLYACHGPTNRRPDPVDYEDAPDQARWERDLGGQTRLTVTAAEAASAVAQAWERVSGRPS